MRNFINLKKWPALCFTSVYVMTVVVLQIVDVWHNYFFSHHIVYLLYNLLRSVFLIIIIWLVFFTGTLFIPDKLKQNNVDLIDVLIFKNFAGISVWILAMFLLGFARLYYTSIVLLLTASLCFLSYPCLVERYNAGKNFYIQNRSRWYEKLKADLPLNTLSFLILCIVSVHILSIYIAFVLYPFQNGNNDELGNYLPYYSQAVYEIHGIWPTDWYIHYFLLKGSGLHFLAMVLTDTHSCKIINFYLFLLGGLILFQLIRKMGLHLIWPLLALTLYLHTVSDLGFIKNHIMFSSCMIFMTYLCSMIISSPEDHLKSLIHLSAIIVPALVIMSSTLSFLYLYILFFSLSITIITGEKYLAIFFMKVIFTVIFSISAVYLINYSQTGVVDFALRFLDKFVNVERLEKWVSPVALYIQIVFNSGDLGFSPISFSDYHQIVSAVAGALKVHGLSLSLSQFNLNPPEWSIDAIVLIPFVTLVYQIIHHGKKFITGRGNIIILSLSHLMLISFFIFMKKDSSMRVINFTQTFTILIWIFTLFTIFNPLNFNSRHMRKATSAVYISLIAALVFISFNSFGVYMKNTFDMAKLQFLTGQLSYGEVYDRIWGTEEFWLIQSKIIPGQKIISLQFNVGAYGLPHSQFQRPFQNSYNDEIDTVLYGTPEQAIEVLLRKGIKYAYINTENKSVFALPTMLAPVFSAENLPKYWRVVNKKDHDFKGTLLTLEKEGSYPVDAQFIHEYDELLQTSVLLAKEAYIYVRDNREYFR